MIRSSLFLCCASLLGVAIAPAQEGRLPVRLDTSPQADSPDSGDVLLAQEGGLWVACWMDERTPGFSLDDDLYMAVSTDAGLSWGPDFAVTNYSATGFDVDDSSLAVADGVIYLSFDEDSLGQSTAHLMASNDLGATWSDLSYVGDLDDPMVFASGQQVVVLMTEGGGTPQALLADYSTTGFAGLSGSPITVSGAGGDADPDSADLSMVGSTAHIVFLDTSLSNPQDDLWYRTLELTTGALSPREQINTSAHDVDTRCRVVASATNVDVAWVADKHPGAGSTADDLLFYRRLDLGTSLWGSEQLLSALLADVDYFDLAVQDDQVLIAFADDLTGDSRPQIAQSPDGGLSFTFLNLPQAAFGSPDAQWFGASIQGEYQFVLAEDDSWTASSADELPSFWYSRDSGTTWQGPFLLGQGFAANEDIDTIRQAWLFHPQGLAGLFQSDLGGGAGGPAMMFSALNFPFASMQALPGQLQFLQLGHPQAHNGDFARWAVSTTLGTQVHPENPALEVSLGPSVAYTATTQLPPLPPITSVIDSQGIATKNLAITLPPGTYYLQAWSNPGSLVGGRAAGEIFQLTL